MQQSPSHSMQSIPFLHTQRVSFPHDLSWRMVSHTLMSQKGSYCSGLMHSQTQWVCRPESHFLLGEVSHCNKAGRGSQGTASTPGHGKGSAECSTHYFSQGLVQNYSSILHALVIQSSSTLNPLKELCCVTTKWPQFCGFTPQLYTLRFWVKAFVICETLSPNDKSEKGISQAEVLFAMQRLHEVTFQMSAAPH